MGIHSQRDNFSVNKIRNIYLSQISDQYGDNMYFPYSAGVVVANAFKEDLIRDNYVIKEIFLKRENIDTIVDRLENPYLFAFSLYLWNYEYSLELSKRIKLKYPDCLIVVGGHNVSLDHCELLENKDFIDIMIHGEGEEPFLMLLTALCKETSLDSISNISFRGTEGIIKTPLAIQKIDMLPSAYLSNIFDDIIKENKYNYSAILETNRGCPFGCSYCDYGSLLAYGKKLRQFPIERIKSEIEWFGKNKIEFVFCADANFGILKRDLEIVDFLIATHNKYGYPQHFRVCYSKNNVNAVYEINKKLNSCGMSRGGTVSFQSFNKEVLKNIGRENIPVSQFSELIKLYVNDSTPVYSELILGLPGETYKSFCEGVNILMSNGQHTGIFIYNCEVLPNAPMAQSDYIQKYEIEVLKTPAVRIHTIKDDSDITEYDNYIVKTYSMSKSDWINMNIFSNIIQSFHALGLTQKIAIYLYLEHGYSYSDFYNKLISYIGVQDSDSVLNSIYNNICRIIDDALNRGACLEFRNEVFGDICWSIDEGIFLQAIERLDDFYSEIFNFLRTFTCSFEPLESLLIFQKSQVVSLSMDSEYTMEYDFYSYFKAIADNEGKQLRKVKNTIISNNPKNYKSMKEYAYEVIWYGRKRWKMVNKDISINYY